MNRPSPLPSRILMTADAVGGVWRYALDLCRSLAARDIGVLLLGLGPPPGEAERAEARALQNVELRWTDLPLDWMAADENATAGLPEHILRLAEGAEADVLHLNLPTQVAKNSSLPTVAASHSCFATWWSAVHPGEPFPARWDWHRRRTGSGLRAADAVLAPSAAHADALRDAYGDLPNLHIVRNGSALCAENRPKEDVVVSLGRWWDAAKNASALDDAAEYCRPPIFIAGPLIGPDGSRYEPRYVKALGSIDRSETQAILARAAIFVSTAVYEPFGLSVLEAARSGCALVLSDVSTFRELWDDAALFVDPHDPRDIARAIDDLGNDPQWRQAAAAAAQKRAYAYGLEAQAEGVIEVYRRALQRRPAFAEAR